MAKLTLNSKEDVRQAIRKRGNKIAEKMTDKELFLSQEFSTYATKLADFILRKHRLYSLDIHYDDSEGAFTAFTDGKKIVCNFGNELIRASKLLERRFKSAMGMLFHEAAHKLFLDFSAFQEIVSTLESGKLYGEFPTNGNPELEQAKAELEQVMASGYKLAVTQIYKDLSNSIDDGHDEASMRQCFPGFITECIKTINEVMLELTPTVEELVAKKMDDYGIRDMLILEYAKNGCYKTGNATKEVDDILTSMIPLESTIETMLQIDDYRERWNWLNLLVLQLWPWLRTKFPDNPQQNPSQGQSGDPNAAPQSGGGQGAGGSGSRPALTDQQIQQILQQLAQQAANAAHAAPAPVNGSGDAVNKAAIQTGGIDAGAETTANILAQEIAKAQAENDVQKELDKAQMDLIRNTDLPLVHKHVPYKVKRHCSPNENAYRLYYKEVEPYVRNLVKEMKALLRELNEESIQHHRAFGPIVEATEAYRPDNAFFAKKKLPEDLPNMAVCVLIDQSGSMGGPKLECAKKTAILLERFASEIGIPVMIAGHNVPWQVELRIYTDFVSAHLEKDRYTLADLGARGCNRDGLAIRLCAEMLAKRTEDIRLMVVISDGAPADDGYSGAEARKDIRETVGEFRRKGLQIYGAAIDDDRDVIQSIYGKGFLSITNLSSLPKTLVRLVRQQAIN